MASQEKNKQLYIDKEAISVLNLAQEGLLYPVTELMNEAQMKAEHQAYLEEVFKTQEEQKKEDENEKEGAGGEEKEKRRR